jgi:hypothetical protein
MRVGFVAISVKVDGPGRGFGWPNGSPNTDVAAEIALWLRVELRVFRGNDPDCRSGLVSR